MRFGKKILGLLAGIMCLGALASCNSGAKKGAIEKVYMYLGSGDPVYTEYTVETMNQAKGGTYEGDEIDIGEAYIVVCPTKDVTIKSVTYHFKNTQKYDTERLKNSTYFTAILDKKATKYNEAYQSKTKEAVSIDLNQSDFTITLNKTAPAGKYFHIIISEGGEWSNISLTYEEN